MAFVADILTLFSVHTLGLTSALKAKSKNSQNFNYIYFKLIKTLQNCRGCCAHFTTCAQVAQKQWQFCTTLMLQNCHFEMSNFTHLYKIATLSKFNIKILVFKIQNSNFFLHYLLEIGLGHVSL